MVEEIRYPSGENRLIRFLRFLNVLDPDHNILSPVRVQAWATTLGAVLTVDTADLTSHQGQIQSGLSVVYAIGAHVMHFFDKKQRARNLGQGGGNV